MDTYRSSAPDLQRRYAEKPMVKLLDAYVLWAIDALPPDQNAALQQMAPRLRQTWNRTEENWHDVVAAQMQFPPNMPAIIRDMWQKNQTITANSKASLTLQDFTCLFVDQNFNR
jgi:hypothetical protein